MEETFLTQIAAQPDSDSPRLWYADWLEEQGQGARAELIRLQCARGAVGIAVSNSAAEREAELLSRHDFDWTEHLPFHKFAEWVFHRGFPEELVIELRTLLEQIPRWSAAPGVRWLTLWDVTANSLEAFAQQPWSPTWIILRLSEDPRPDRHVQPRNWAVALAELLNRPEAARLSEFWLSVERLHPAEVAVLASDHTFEGVLYLGRGDHDPIPTPLLERFRNRLRRGNV